MHPRRAARAPRLLASASRLSHASLTPLTPLTLTPADPVPIMRSGMWHPARLTRQYRLHARAAFHGRLQLITYLPRRWNRVPPRRRRINAEHDAGATLFQGRANRVCAFEPHLSRAVIAEQCIVLPCPFYVAIYIIRSSHLCSDHHIFRPRSQLAPSSLATRSPYGCAADQISVRATHLVPHVGRMACFFTAQGRMETLPCPYSWDVSNPMHALGQVHAQGCQRNPLGSGSLGSGYTCTVVAEYVTQHCLWPRAPEVHAVHFKGRHKPWMQIILPCRPVRLGAMVTAGRRRIRLDLGDRVAWANGACQRVALSSLLQNSSSSGQLAATETYEPADDDEQGEAASNIVTWADGAKVHPRCCNHVHVLKAEWYRQARSVRGWAVVDHGIPKPVR